MTDVSIHSEACQWDLFVQQTTIKHTVVCQQLADQIWRMALSKWCILPHHSHNAWIWTTVITSWHLPTIIYLPTIAVSSPCLPSTIVVITAIMDSHLYHRHLVWLHHPIHPCYHRLDNHSHPNSNKDSTPCLLVHLDPCLDITLVVTVLIWCLPIWLQQQTSITDRLPQFIHTWFLKSISMINV